MIEDTIPPGYKRKLREWYCREGFIQFMLGNEWNCYDLRDIGRITLLFCWAVILISLVPFMGAFHC